MLKVSPALSREWSVYALCDPSTGDERYVGWSFNPKKRLSQHLNSARKGVQTHNAAWLRQLLAMGLRPNIKILQTGTDNPAHAEIFWIQTLRNRGARLTNLTAGGDGLWGASAETRAKISKLKRGVKHSAKARANMSAGRRSSEKVKANLELLHRNNVGRKQSDAERRKRSLIMKNSARAQANMAQLNASRIGHIVSVETRNKIRQALKRNLQSYRASRGQKSFDFMAV